MRRLSAPNARNDRVAAMKSGLEGRNNVEDYVPAPMTVMEPQ